MLGGLLDGQLIALKGRCPLTGEAEAFIPREEVLFGLRWQRPSEIYRNYKKLFDLITLVCHMPVTLSGKESKMIQVYGWLLARVYLFICKNEVIVLI